MAHSRQQVEGEIQNGRLIVGGIELDFLGVSLSKPHTNEMCMHVHKYMHTHLIIVFGLYVWCYAYHKSTLLQIKEGFLYHE